MSGWQIMFGAALLAASCVQWRNPLFIVAMWANYLATLTLNADMVTVIVFDLLAAALLVMRGARESVVAALFLCMIPIYCLTIFGEWPPATTYGIVEIVAYIQLLVMGRIDGGLRAIRGWLSGRGEPRPDRHAALPQGPITRVTAQHDAREGQ